MSSGSTSPVRADIQALRAIAVAAVVTYHLWPGALPGGYTGVDVFFVISGFLITTHLVIAATNGRPAGLHNLLQFWSRRIRRLLPASLLVLLVTLIASRLVAPATQWANTASQVRAAALYFVNWRLADQAVDYLARNDAPSPVEHFWSLSVEEQFYLVWPLLILAATAAARRLHRGPLPVIAVVLTAVTAASLWFSVHETGYDPAKAYFVTPTRAWEFGAGGLLALFLQRPDGGRYAGPWRRTGEAAPRARPARVVLAWLGLAAIAATLATFTAATPFPGYAALLPVTGTAAVIAARAPSVRWSPAPGFALRPVQWLGNVSYSLYLWHWPLIVLVPDALHRPPGPAEKVAVLLASLSLAGLTKRYVEDRFRRPSATQRGRAVVAPFAFAAAAMAVVAGGSLLQTAEVNHQLTVDAATVRARLAHGGRCFGAAALDRRTRPACPPTRSGQLVPSPVYAVTDRSQAYRGDGTVSNCFAGIPSFRQLRCSFGDRSSPVDVALVGNSHAGQWLPAVDAACLRWERRTVRRVAAGRYSLVILADRVSVDAAGARSLAASESRYETGDVSVLRSLRAAREPVVVLRDTPAPGTSVPDCLAANTGDYLACAGRRSAWVPAEPAAAAVRALHDPRIRFVDLLDHICGPQVCDAAVGGVPVYFDGSHLTATYARTLAPYLAPYLIRAVADGRIAGPAPARR